MFVGRIRVFGLICLIACLFSGCTATEDVRFARNIMIKLINGVYSVREEIDWSSLRMMERDIGSEYKQLPTDQAREAYERAFVKGFELSFKERGGSIKAFKDWRFYSRMDPAIGVVITNSADKKSAFLFFIKHEKGKKKLVEMKSLIVLNPDVFYKKV